MKRAKKTEGNKIMDYILAIDQGTTVTTAMIMNRDAKIISQGSSEYPQHYPKAGFVEHLGAQIKISVKNACSIAIKKAKINPNDIIGIGITNQRETVALFEHNGECVRPFIVWQCRRSKGICDDLKKRNLNKFFHEKTGLPLDPYFSASKLLWLFRQESELLKQAQAGRIIFGTIDTFLCHWFSDGDLHITDSTNASRTMLMDIRSCQWDEQCLDIFSIPKQMLPSIRKSIGPYGKTKNLGFLPDGIPIAAIAGDQQAALFGQACFNIGDAKATYGTGSFILLNTGEKLIFSKYGLVTSIAYHIDNNPIYCLEGSAFIAGAAVQFLRENLGIIETADQVEELANSVVDNGGVVFIPALCGLGAPHWRAEARGVFFGLHRGTKKGHIARATLEGIALQNTDIIMAMAEEGVKPISLKVDGAAAKNNLLIQIQADLLDVVCIRPKNFQKTVLGIAYLAALALGVFSSIKDIMKTEEKLENFKPNLDRTAAIEMIKNYHLFLKKI
jgi:glycerol kinase